MADTTAYVVKHHGYSYLTISLRGKVDCSSNLVESLLKEFKDGDMVVLSVVKAPKPLVDCVSDDSIKDVKLGRINL